VGGRRREFPVEIQVRTELQHSWAELSEKIADRFGIEVKYGGGAAEIQDVLKATAGLCADVESKLEVKWPGDERVGHFKAALRKLFAVLPDKLK
jgi:ppGpp synthetase/RelA/SpoT-type nucleotidyltranferase